MAYEQRDNSGSLFKNEEKRNENGPDYSGKCTVGGVEYYFDSWLKRPEGKKAFMSFAFKPTAKDAPVTDTRTQAQRRAPVDDDVPF